MNGQLYETKYQPPRAYAAETGTALGRGVFAGTAFRTGEVVEVAPVVPIDEDFQDLPLAVRRVVFNWSKLQGSTAKFALAMGFGSLYNHSDHPNLRYSGNARKLTLTFRATRDILPGEQLTISYNQVKEGAAPRVKNWFETNGVEKIEVEELRPAKSKTWFEEVER